MNPPLGKAPSLQLHLPCCPVLPMFAPCRPSLQAPSQAATTAHSGTSTRAIRAFGALGAFQGARWCAEEARGRAGLRAWGRRAGRRRELGWGTTTGPPVEVGRVAPTWVYLCPPATGGEPPRWRHLSATAETMFVLNFGTWAQCDRTYLPIQTMNGSFRAYQRRRRMRSNRCKQCLDRRI